MNKKQKNSVLIVDDEKANIIALTHILRDTYTVYAAKNGRDAVELAQTRAPTVILLDVIMPEMSGYEVLNALKNDARTKDIPVIFITGLATSESEVSALSLGAADYIAKPFNTLIVKLRVKNQVQMQNQLEVIKYLSTTDQLTNVANRRDFDNRLAFEWERAKRDKTPLSILMIDIDHFKRYNDSHGHLQGDISLKTVASSIKSQLSRSIDYVARWGGEEFACLLPLTDSPGALSVAENIRKTVEAAAIICPNGDAAPVTVSIGVNTEVPQRNKTTRDFVDRADTALYEAKRAGRNKVMGSTGGLN